MSKFEPLLTKGNVRYLRPTLYDLLAHRALEYYGAGEREARNAAMETDFINTAAFETAPEFIKTKFTTKDSSASTFKALLIYQKLVSFHLEDSRPDALIDVNLARLNFVKQWSNLPDKLALYKAALQKMIAKYATTARQPKRLIHLADYYVGLGNNADLKADPEWENALSKALNICEKGYSQFPQE